MVRGRGKGRFFLLAGFLGRLPLLLVLARPTAVWVIGMYLLVSVSNALVITASNAVYQARYSDATRTQRFGLATSVAGITSMAVTCGAGWLLQADESRFPLLYLVAAIAGVLQAWHLYRMATPASDLPGAAGWVLERLGGWRLLREWPVPWSPRVTGERMNAAQREFRATLRSSLHLLRDHPEFVRFERNYMIYGFAFMFLVPVLPLYVVHDLGMNYQQLALTKGLWAQVGVVVLSPVLGLAMDRLNPLRFTGKVFFALSLFPLCLFASTFGGIVSPVTWVYAALLFFSLAMAGVNISWSLGSMYFAGNEDASAFQGLHVAMTGVRGLIAPAIGYSLYELAGPRLVFLCAAILLWAGSFLMLRQGARTAAPARAPG